MRLRQRRRMLAASRGEVRRRQEFREDRSSDRAVAWRAQGVGTPGHPLRSLVRGTAGTATAVFCPLPPLAGGKGRPLSLLSASPPSPTISLLLTTRGPLSRPHPQMSVSGTPCNLLPSTLQSLPNHGPSFSHSKSYPVFSSPSPSFAGGVPGLEPLPYSAEPSFHFPTLPRAAVLPRPVEKSDVSQEPLHFRRHHSELEPASPLTPALPRVLHRPGSPSFSSPPFHSPGALRPQ